MKEVLRKVANFCNKVKNRNTLVVRKNLTEREVRNTLFSTYRLFVGEDINMASSIAAHAIYWLERDEDGVWLDRELHIGLTYSKKTGDEKYYTLFIPLKYTR